MSFSKVLSATVFGLSVEFVHVEADVSNGLPVFQMVGYLSSEVKEASFRVRTAIANSGISLPPKKMVINLAPANVKKRGAIYDVAIAISLMCAMGYVEPKGIEGTIVIGELGLDGRLQEVNGVLPILLEAKKEGITKCILPAANAKEAALVGGITILAMENLVDIIGYLNGEIEANPYIESLESLILSCEPENLPDFRDIRGQEGVKRAAEIAAAGAHNLLLVGPPGSGKSMLASRLPSIMPKLTLGESLEVTKVYSVMGLLRPDMPLITRPPYRNVHHTATKVSLTGGGILPHPGEISLAHKGILFLDELAEFEKPVLEVLRQPLEEHEIHITRTFGSYTFPASFMLVAAMNPCPCGNFPDYDKCSCSQSRISQYLSRVSQAFLDRIDVCMEAPRITFTELESGDCGESSAQIRERVVAARKIQEKRFEGTNTSTNSAMTVKETEKYCALEPETREMLKKAYQTMNLTARTYHKILKVARTIADLDNKETVLMKHVKEALSYRTLDKKYWGR
ncbi:MAG: YifB family Mg chelatase-like AAA ATPase [Lachnospiraceae bacterium]|jgi:magnesium chelatase family protein|nr:YifB family Mg chelatase-like AAA ATPase [Lachnospiraceae bacterium]